MHCVSVIQLFLLWDAVLKEASGNLVTLSINHCKALTSYLESQINLHNSPLQKEDRFFVEQDTKMDAMTQKLNSVTTKVEFVKGGLAVRVVAF